MAISQTARLGLIIMLSSKRNLIDFSFSSLGCFIVAALDLQLRPEANILGPKSAGGSPRREAKQGLRRQFEGLSEAD
jgi:hypothetical protein